MMTKESEDSMINFEIDNQYKSVVISYNFDSVLDFVGGLPQALRKKIFSLIEENKKSENTVIPMKIKEGLYSIIHSKNSEETGEPDFVLYVFESRQDMVDLLDRKPLNVDIEEEIKKAILKL